MDGFWTRRLISEVGSARAARLWVRDALDGVGTRDDTTALSSLIWYAVLCTSELVNASLIAGSTTMLLELRADDHLLRISLKDDGITPSGEHDPLAHAQDLSFRLIQASAQCMGIECHDNGRELWAWLSTDHSDRPRHAPAPSDA